MRRLWWLLVPMLLLAGCGERPAGGEAVANADAETAAANAADPLRDAAFLVEDTAWRAQRREGLLQPDGWTSLVGLHWIELKAHYVGSGATNGIRLAKGPDKMGLLQQQDGRVFLTPERGVALTVDGTPAKGRFELRADSDAAPTVVGFDDGKGRLTLIDRGGRKALRVKHAEADARVRFGALDYWPADPRWRVAARLLPHPPGKTLAVTDIQSMQQPLPNPGVVEFERDGRTFRLEALEGEDGGLFLIFADRTSGHGSYGAGRYLYTGAPDGQGNVVVDFNRAFNPPCAFTDYATCPLPPPENRLDLAIEAGEKKYARPAS